MEKIEIIREKFKEACRMYSASNGSESYYYEGKMVGMVEGVSAMMDISWIEADILLRKEE